MKLENKVALVTGGARDIGRAVSLNLAKAGASVVINYYDNEEQAKETLQMINDIGGKATIIQGDMTNWDSVQNLSAKAVDAFGKIDVLVNVAGGLMGRHLITEMKEEFWDLVMNLNLKSVYYGCKAVIPNMNDGGTIVNFTSQAARDGGGFGAIAYATAKGGVLTFTRGLAKELGSRRIRVNAVSPGMINTTFHDQFTKPEIREKVAASTPLGREGKAQEVAELVLFLASDSSSFINGESVEINGGIFFS
ncbi:MAG: 3-oxoacyl-ACP reductase family protein [Ignavibacteria bacterium]|nr:3-oxoacyl-ACP reductase family protein [Ignavibacteria bacterium]